MTPESLAVGGTAYHRTRSCAPVSENKASAMAWPGEGTQRRSDSCLGHPGRPGTRHFVAQKIVRTLRAIYQQRDGQGFLLYGYGRCSCA